ncbi:MAG: rhodanese-like domain-containing protein [Oligoflexia bacterium]|nr:rhodanese-like domain-containing protein [Oligoflexia bacterium]
MKNLEAKELKVKLDNEEKICLVDVRSIDEYRSGHVPKAICMPLDQIESKLEQLPKDKLLVLNCQSGNRSKKAREVLASHGYTNILELEGGFNAWVKSDLPIKRNKKSIPIMRQVQISAGLLVAVGTIAGLTISTNFLFLPLFVGCGLTFAGLSGWCGMALLLEKMPWNR